MLLPGYVQQPRSPFELIAHTCSRPTLNDSVPSLNARGVIVLSDFEELRASLQQFRLFFESVAHMSVRLTATWPPAYSGNVLTESSVYLG